jgi:hypothetical protein
MNWYSLYKFAQSSYGAWIAPSGEVLDTGAGVSHEDFGAPYLVNNLGYDKSLLTAWTIDGKDTEAILFGLGYVRFVYSPFNVEVEKKLTNSQKRAIARLVQSSDANSLTFDSKTARISKTVKNKIDAMEILRAM